MRKRDGDIRIGELVRRSGVSRATIQHYLNEGLLPRPRKTGQTMAYYDAATVDRVRLIKDMQRRHLPLQAIRALLEPRRRRVVPRMTELARRGEELEALLAPNERPLSRGEVERETGVDDEALDELERLGFVRARKSGGAASKRELRYGPCDVAVLRAVGQLGAAGLDSSRGFGIRDLHRLSPRRCAACSPARSSCSGRRHVSARRLRAAGAGRRRRRQRAGRGAAPASSSPSWSPSAARCRR